MDTNVQMRDVLWRVGLTMNKAIGRAIREGSVQIGKPLNIWHSHLIIDPNLRCLVVGWNLDGWSGEVR